MPKQQHSTVWVCVDCYQAHHGMTEHERGEAYPAEVLSKLGVPSVDVSAGMMADEHDPGCTALADGGDCECERRAFSWSPCDGCGSTLGGSREALTIWY